MRSIFFLSGLLAIVAITHATEKGKPLTPKYFKEPGGSMGLSHYDARYYGHELPYEEHRFVLRDLIQSYLTTLSDLGAETWLAHGTLLGWFWNGEIMPWDYDLDVQVSNHTLAWLANNQNYTMHNYTTTQGKMKTYHLDISPHHSDINRGDGQNIIDARWIDMSNGMFVDITGVREREADKPGVWSCKNKHRYKAGDIWPLRRTTFEGVHARVPFNTAQVLVLEYGAKCLVVEEWEGHRWNSQSKKWNKMSPAEEKRRKSEALRRKKLDLQVSKPH